MEKKKDIKKNSHLNLTITLNKIVKDSLSDKQ